MFVFRQKYTVDGETRESLKWTAAFKAPDGRQRRLPTGMQNRKNAEAFGRRLDELAGAVAAHEPLPPGLSAWLEGLPAATVERLKGWGLLSGIRTAAGKCLAEHVEAWRSYLTAKGNKPRYVGMKVSRVLKVVDGCGFTAVADISGADVMNHLHKMRDGGDGISAQTFNHYLQAAKQFTRWLCADGRAAADALSYLAGLNTRTDRRHDHRALTPEEIPHLMDAAATGPTIRGLDGPTRTLLYELAITTGARASELLSTRREDFRLDAEPPTITLQAGYTKSKRTDTLPLKAATAARLRNLLARTERGGEVFGGIRAERVRLAEAMKADLEAARTAWLENAGDDEVERQRREQTDFLVFEDSAGRFADFHCLRHTAGSLLAAGGVHPSVAKEILRHTDIRLTMNLYTHAYGGAVAAAVEGLPDVGLKTADAQCERKNRAGS